MTNKQQQISAIRFNGFTDAWEQRKWSETVDISTEMVNPKTGEYDSLPHIGPGNIESFTGRILDNVKSVKEDNLISGKFHFYPGDVIYGKINPQLGKYAMVDFEGLASADSYVLNTKNGVSQTFLFTILQGTSFYKYSVSVSMRTGMPKINRDELNQYSYSAPSVVEQEKISHFFKQLDGTIALHQRQLDNYKQLKKAMQQKIFNQEFRFKDENGNDYPDWEEIALKELGETFTGLSGKTKENFGKGKGKFVTYMNVFSNPIANLTMTENVEIKDGEKQNEVCYGDIFFTTSSETPEEVGMSSIWLSHESNVYLNSFCFGYRLNTESEGKVKHQFLGVQLRAEHMRKKIVLLAQGSTRFNISKAKLTEIPVYLPTIQEQEKITDFLLMAEARIDRTIQKIEWMKEQKKGFMQQMFV